jgi:hypothetical protein
MSEIEPYVFQEMLRHCYSTIPQYHSEHPVLTFSLSFRLIYRGELRDTKNFVLHLFQRLLFSGVV